MSIYTYLKQDHEKIQRLMNDIEALGAEESGERSKLFNQLKATIIVHSKAEEKAFYDPLKKHPKTKQEVNHSEEEHEEAEQLLTDLTDSSLTGAAWFQKFKVLKKNLEHHMREEESDIFADAKQVVDSKDADLMEQAMRAEKQHQVADKTIQKRPNI